MKKDRFLLPFLVVTATVFAANIAIIIIFTLVRVEDSFYKSLNVASLSIAFLSFIASSFFSLSVYLQSKAQGKINESLPKKDDQYIISNYSLFNLEKEISFFSLDAVQAGLVMRKGRCLFDGGAERGAAVTRLVLLPTDSLNIPTYRVTVRSVALFCADGSELYRASAEVPVDTEYSANILQRGYNCICIDLAAEQNAVEELFTRTSYMEIQLDIISVFNVKMSTKFFVYLDAEKSVEHNPDKTSLPDLCTYTVHHSNYVIEEKSILTGPQTEEESI
jgi:hypothetical protein